MGGVVFITTISLFHFLETANTQKSEVFQLSISSGNVNASVVATCQYPQFYKKFPKKNFSMYDLLLPHSMNRLIIFFFWQEH